VLQRGLLCVLVCVHAKLSLFNALDYFHMHSILKGKATVFIVISQCTNFIPFNLEENMSDPTRCKIWELYLLNRYILTCLVYFILFYFVFIY
jgi:hypothetical protein